MKKLKVILLSLGMALCAGGAIGTAFAAVSKTSATSTSEGAFDKAVVLYWDSETSTKPARLTDMETLQTDVAQYRHLIVSPKTSKSVSGTVTVHFVLETAAAAGKTAVLKGLTVKVYELSSENEITDDNYQSLVASGTLKCTITPASATTGGEGNATFTVAAGDAVHETVKHYAIEVVYDGTKIESTEKLSGQLKISQAFAA